MTTIARIKRADSHGTERYVGSYVNAADEVMGFTVIVENHRIVHGIINSPRRVMTFDPSVDHRLTAKIEDAIAAI